jgi:hypothetical protein
VEPTRAGVINKEEARRKVTALSEKYGLHVEPDALIEDISVGSSRGPRSSRCSTATTRSSSSTSPRRY